MVISHFRFRKSWSFLPFWVTNLSTTIVVLFSLCFYHARGTWIIYRTRFCIHQYSGHENAISISRPFRQKKKNGHLPLWYWIETEKLSLSIFMIIGSALIATLVTKAVPAYVFEGMQVIISPGNRLPSCLLHGPSKISSCNRILSDYR